MKKDRSNLQKCPCDSGESYNTCCKKHIEKITDAPSAETLMRSRYTAFTQNNVGYLRHSWHPATRPENIRLNSETTWLGLKILNKTAGGKDDKEGEVEFVARYKINGKTCRIHEISQFTRINTRWVYIDGKIAEKQANPTA